MRWTVSSIRRRSTSLCYYGRKG